MKLETYITQSPETQDIHVKRELEDKILIVIVLHVKSNLSFKPN